MDTEARLTAYMDGELSAADVALLERELQVDEALATELLTLQRAVALVREHGRIAAPDDFHARLMAETDDLAVPVALSNWRRRPFGIPIQALALAALALLVIFVALPEAPTEPAPVLPASQLQIPDAPATTRSSLDVPRTEEPIPQASPEFFVGHVPTGGLMLTTMDPEALTRLLDQRDTLGIALIDEYGNAIEEGELDERVTVWLEVPIQNYKAVEHALEKLGHLRKGPEEMAGGTVTLSLQIQLRKAYPMKPILPD